MDCGYRWDPWPLIGWMAIWLVSPLPAQVVKVDAPVTALAFAPDGQAVLIGSQAGIQVLSWPELQVRADLSTDLVNVHDLRFSPDGQSLLVAGGTPAESGIVEQWRWPESTRRWRATIHDDLVYQAVWLPDGRSFATASADSRCCLCDSESGQVLLRFEGHSRPVLAVDALDNDTVISAGVDQTVRVWDRHNGSTKRTLENHLGSVIDIAVAQASQAESEPRLVTVGQDRTVRLWNPGIGRLIRFQRLPADPTCVAWSPNQTLLVGCANGDVLVMDSTSLGILDTIAGKVGLIREMAVPATEPVLLVAGDQGIRQIKMAVFETR